MSKESDAFEESRAIVNDLLANACDVIFLERRVAERDATIAELLEAGEALAADYAWTKGNKDQFSVYAESHPVKRLLRAIAKARGEATK